MGVNIDLHFTATSIEELKEQLKQAYEQLNGPVVETPKKESTKTEYQKDMADRTKAAMADKKKNLKKYTGHLFGWDSDENNNLHPNWKEQDQITLMRDWYTKLGTYAAVAKRATGAGWKGKRGGEWTSSLIKRTLTNDLHERVVEFTRPPFCKACNGAHRAHACERGRKTKAKVKAKEPSKVTEAFTGPCKECGATKTPQWRNKKDSFGPLCNACAMARKRQAKKKAARKTRGDDIRANIVRMQKKKTKKGLKKKETKIEPVPKVEIEVSEDAFLRWSQGNVSSMILRDKTFIIGSKVIESWFTTINPSENFGSWANDNLPNYMTHVKLIFDKFEATYSTIFMVQDAGDNCVLMVNQPKALTAKKLDKVRWL